VPGNREGPLEAGFRLGRIRGSLAQQEFALKPIRLCMHVAPSAGLKSRQRLGEQAQSLYNLAGVPRRLGEQSQTGWPRQRLPYGHYGCHALVHLRPARLDLTLHGQRPAIPEGSIPYMERKSLRGRQGQEGVGQRLDYRRLTAAVMQVSQKVRS